jgi:hypothetical protein
MLDTGLESNRALLAHLISSGNTLFGGRVLCKSWRLKRRHAGLPPMDNSTTTPSSNTMHMSFDSLRLTEQLRTSSSFDVE